NLSHQPRPQLHRQRFPRGLHRLPRHKPRRLLIHLYGSPVAPHLDNLPGKPPAAHPDHIKHLCLSHSFGHPQPPCPLLHHPGTHSIIPPFLCFGRMAIKGPYASPKISAPTACLVSRRASSIPRPVFPDNPGIRTTTGSACSRR